MKRVVTLIFTRVSDIDHGPFNPCKYIFFSISEAFIIIDVKLHSNVKDNGMKISLAFCRFKHHLQCSHNHHDSETKKYEISNA